MALHLIGNIELSLLQAARRAIRSGDHIAVLHHHADSIQHWRTELPDNVHVHFLASDHIGSDHITMHELVTLTTTMQPVVSWY